jgi:hypothetical protein
LPISSPSLRLAFHYLNYIFYRAKVLHLITQFFFFNAYTLVFQEPIA